MPVLKLKSRHSLSPDEATARVKKRIAEEVEKQARYVTELKETATLPNKLEYSCKVYGFNLSGQFHSTESEVAVEVNLPFAAMMVKGMIESQLQSALDQALS
ncbi:MAG: polyhydroxyalkanoic acid system family protein [Planctomycetaceae bacterium]|nr:polyhydroxyalkanoic acid system family protein [Planctomycetaceae bacterium]